MDSVAAPASPGLTLDDRYLREEGRVHLAGMQASAAADRPEPPGPARGPPDRDLHQRLSGLAAWGYDLALRQARPILVQHDIRHVPGANEELAATALSGTQMLDRYPHSRYDGVVGSGTGKGPGVDRSGDALKHRQLRRDEPARARWWSSPAMDHEAKSSTMPYQDDYAFVGHGMLVIYPASTGEFLTLGSTRCALSRFSGCWVAMKPWGSSPTAARRCTSHRTTPGSSCRSS